MTDYTADIALADRWAAQVASVEAEEITLLRMIEAGTYGKALADQQDRLDRARAHFNRRSR